MDYHPEGSKTPRSKRLRLFTVSHVCVFGSGWAGDGVSISPVI